MINALLVVAVVVLLLAIVWLKSYDTGRKVGQAEGFLFAVQLGTEAADDPDPKQRDWERHAAGVAPWN